VVSGGLSYKDGDILGAPLGMTSGRAEGTVEGKVDSTPVTLSLAITGDAVADAAVLAQFPYVATGCRFSVQPCGQL
jgi:hypothetical protein